MWSSIVFLLIGLILVLTGADALVDGSSALARRWGVSEFVIGLTIVALGTSAPEMVVSFISSIEGNSDMAVGNIIGSNIFNNAIILGLSALICPIAITHSQKRRDIPINTGITLLLAFFGLRSTLLGIGRNGISRIEGALFLALFVWYMISSFRQESSDEHLETDGSKTKQFSMFKALVYIIFGIAALIFGGRMFVDNAENIAQALGWSDKFIAITILAAGTSLPELATSIVAAAKGRGQLALGNIIGSNTSNILLILGGSALIRPLEMNDIAITDYAALLACSLPVLASAIFNRKGRMFRTEGAALLLVGIIYISFLIITL